MNQSRTAQWKDLGFLATFITAYELGMALCLVALALIPFSTNWKSLPAWQGLLLSFAIQLLVYLLVTAAVWAAYGLLRLHLNIGGLLDARPLKPGQIRQEMLRGISTCVIYAVYTFICLRLSSGLWPASWLAGATQLAVFLALYDFWFYWSHRALHTRAFAAFHGTHHRSVRVTPWSVHSLHPLEAPINQLPFLLFVLAWPTGFGMIVLFQVVIMFMTASGHSNYDPFAQSSGLPRAKAFWRFHQRHHQLGRGNFGFMGLHWDFVFGTAQSQKAE